MEDLNMFPGDRIDTIRHIVDQEFNIERLLRMQDVSQLSQLEEKIVYLTEESSKPYVSPVNVEPSPINNNMRRDSNYNVIFQDTNGRYLSLSCTVCKRSNFPNVQSLMNHCRTVHNPHSNAFQEGPDSTGHQSGVS